MNEGSCGGKPAVENRNAPLQFEIVLGEGALVHPYLLQKKGVNVSPVVAITCF